MRDLEKQITNPFSSGGGGVIFETHVQALFVVLMLAGGGAGECALETASVVILGVAAHAVTTAAGETSTVLVWDDPNQLFQIQEDATGTMTAADVGLNADFAASAEAIDAFTGQSTCELSGTSKDTTNTLLLKILGKVDRVDNAWGDHVDLIVKFSEAVHFNATPTGL